MHKFFFRTRAIVLLLGAALLLASPQQAIATPEERIDRLLRYLFNFLDPFGWIHNLEHQSDLFPIDAPLDLVNPRAPAPPSRGASATFYMFNNEATMENGEPNPGGLMTKTVWGGSTVKKAGRVVVHTFGSDFDTVLAAYRGSTFASMVLLASNDNRAVSGVSTTQSLIQFNVAANTPYRVQIGGKAGAEGDIYANVFVFPPSGGLSAFLATVDGNSWEGREYVCELGFTHATSCPPAKFVVHNSTNQTLTVTPTTSLGGALVVPTAFTLTAGQAKTAEFTYNAGFNRTTLRTVAGSFTFTGRAGSTVVSRTDVSGLISVKSQTGFGPDVLRASVTRQMGTELTNNGIPFDVKLTNTGTQAATGCHARSEVGSRIRTLWQEYDPGFIGSTRPATIHAPNVPVTIPAGSFKWLRVWAASQTPRDGDPVFLGEIVIDCANTAELAFNAANRFDLTQFGSFDPAEVYVLPVSPTSGVLNVPASGVAKFRVSAINAGPAAAMRVNGFYEAPFDDPANSQFVVTGVCEANAAGGCIGPTDGLIFYNAPTNVKKYFNVFVSAPSVNPGYNPGKRRVFLRIKQDAPDNVTDDYVLVGVRSIAVKKL